MSYLDENAMSQNTAILAHLKHLGAITPTQALNHYGCFRLAARIQELREKGHDIETVMTERNGKRFATYTLSGTASQG